MGALPPVLAGALGLTRHLRHGSLSGKSSARLAAVPNAAAPLTLEEWQRSSELRMLERFSVVSSGRGRPPTPLRVPALPTWLGKRMAVRST